MPYPISKQTTPGAPGTGGKWGWVVPILTSVAGAIIDKQSQDRANKANAQNVERQIAFQDEQSRTQYQRAVADMKAAGLNPALAYKAGGNSTESGAAANYERTNTGQRLTEAVAAYNDFANASAQRQVMREQAGLTSAQARKTATEAQLLQPDLDLVTIDADKEDGYRSLYKKGKLAKARADISNAPLTTEQAIANIKNTNQGAATAKQQARLMETQSTLNEQEFMNVWFRKNIAPYINSTAKTMEGVGAVSRTGKGLQAIIPPRRD